MDLIVGIVLTQITSFPQMNLVDLFAVLPYFINFIVDHLSGQNPCFIST